MQPYLYALFVASPFIHIGYVLVGGIVLPPACRWFHVQPPPNALKAAAAAASIAFMLLPMVLAVPLMLHFSAWANGGTGVAAGFVRALTLIGFCLCAGGVYAFGFNTTYVRGIALSLVQLVVLSALGATAAAIFFLTRTVV